MPGKKKDSEPNTADNSKDHLAKISQVKQANLIGDNFEHGFKEADSNLDTILQ